MASIGELMTRSDAETVLRATKDAHVLKEATKHLGTLSGSEVKVGEELQHAAAALAVVSASMPWSNQVSLLHKDKHQCTPKLGLAKRGIALLCTVYHAPCTVHRVPCAVHPSSCSVLCALLLELLIAFLF